LENVDTPIKEPTADNPDISIILRREMLFMIMLILRCYQI
jgi:hypothetical protein